jgi:hypothetical protein
MREDNQVQLFIDLQLKILHVIKILGIFVLLRYLFLTDTYFYRRLSYIVDSNHEFLGEALCQFVYMGVNALSSKPRWACSMCGMYSSRRYSVKRHIINLHNGIGNIVSFIDYITGRRQGVYFPNPIPSYLVKHTQTAASTVRPADVMKDEIFRAVLRKRLGNL